MAKKSGGMKVPKRILGHKLRKGTRKDLAVLLKALQHPDGRALALAAVTALGPFLAKRLAHKAPKLKAAT